MYGGSVYQAAPQAPTLEIKINQVSSKTAHHTRLQNDRVAQLCLMHTRRFQNNSPAPSVYSEATNGYSRHPAPSVPPPPPPVTHPSTNPYYASPKSTYSGKGGDSNTAMLRICILQLLLGCKDGVLLPTAKLPFQCSCLLRVFPASATRSTVRTEVPWGRPFSSSVLRCLVALHRDWATKSST